MSPTAISIRPGSTAVSRRGFWSLLEVVPAGRGRQPFGLILVDEESGEAEIRTREAQAFDLEEDEAEVLDATADDLTIKAREDGGLALLDGLEDRLSNFVRIADREAVTISLSLSQTADDLYYEYVDNEIQRYVTHLPVYALQAAATKFGDQFDPNEDVNDADWMRVPKGTRLEDNMFIAKVVGRSMEPLIPDGAYCIFRKNVTGSRQGKRLLIEKFGDLEHSSRYTIKRYTSTKIINPETGEWEHGNIRLEPLNPEFEAFDLHPDEFRVIAEFVEALSNS